MFIFISRPARPSDEVVIVHLISEVSFPKLVQHDHKSSNKNQAKAIQILPFLIKSPPASASHIIICTVINTPSSHYSYFNMDKTLYLNSFLPAKICSNHKPNVKRFVLLTRITSRLKHCAN